MAEGRKNWYFVDGWLPQEHELKNAGLVGHEAIMILNCCEKDAIVKMDIFYEDKEPDEDIELHVAARRVKCLRMDKPEDIGGIRLTREYQYSVRFRSDVDVIIQYGRMDVTQPNLAYIGFIGYSE